MKINLIVAMASSNHGIGINGKIPWHIPSDLKRFKRITMGNPIIMGRKTFDSIGKPLPGRLNIVLTRNNQLKIEGVVRVSSIEKAIKISKDEGYKEIFIIGGSEIYKQTIGIADKLYITTIYGKFESDTYFPEIPNGFESSYVSEILYHKGLSYQYTELIKK